MNLNTLKNLDILKSLSEQSLKELSHNSHVKTYKNNETIFLRSEKEIYYYVILSGQVKIYSVNNDGEELIMAILEPNEVINNIFNQEHISNGAALKECEILKIKKDFLLKEIKNNTEFVIALLKKESNQNKNLFERLEQLNLMNAEQKVGNFLLKESFENNSKRFVFNLKLKKSTIASYLKIKPETLSRILDRFKKDNKIEIKNCEVLLKNQYSLCEYCSNSISQNCKNNTDAFCSNKNFS